jgi:adenylate cyclase
MAEDDDVDGQAPPSLADLHVCFEGAIPAVVATASTDGTPNVTYLSRVRLVDDERVALSNQFFSKTAKNLAENPQASVLVLDPTSYRAYRLTLRYERTERRGPVFDRLRADVDDIAALSGMEDVFRLRAADIYRVLAIHHVATPHSLREDAGEAVEATPEFAGPGPQHPGPTELAGLTALLSRSPDLDGVVSATVEGLVRIAGYETAVLLLLDEAGEQLYTIASHGFETEGVGSEVPLGQGVIGLAAARGTPMRLGNLRQMAKYSSSVRRAFEQAAGEDEIAVPALPDVQSRLAVPALAFGQLVGVIVVESTRAVAFTDEDELALTAVAAVVANAVEGGRARAAVERHEAAIGAPSPSVGRAVLTTPTHVRFFAQDGSTFLDGDYLIKGVAGRILWSLLVQHQREGRVDFTNREVRLDPSLELPELRDNLESRLILLKRRLEERDAPIRVEKTGRGQFRLDVATDLRLEAVDAT